MSYDVCSRASSQAAVKIESNLNIVPIFREGMRPAAAIA